jgi:acetyl-CoA acyltransferase 1
MAMRSPLCKYAKGGYKDMRTDELITAMLKATIPLMPVQAVEVQDICVGMVQGAGALPWRTSCST